MVDSAVGVAAALGKSFTTAAQRRVFLAYKEHYNEEQARGKRTKMYKHDGLCITSVSYSFPSHAHQGFS
jgi:hypothetical protein